EGAGAPVQRAESLCLFSLRGHADLPELTLIFTRIVAMRRQRTGRLRTSPRRRVAGVPRQRAGTREHRGREPRGIAYLDLERQPREVARAALEAVGRAAEAHAPVAGLEQLRVPEIHCKRRFEVGPEQHL